MDDRLEFYRKELRKDLSISEIVNLLHSIFEEVVDADGCSVLLQESEKCYLVSENKKLLIDQEKKSLSFKAMNEKKALLVESIAEENYYNSEIDNVDNDPIASEIFFPLFGEYPVVINIWKNIQEEEEEVMTPLIVGNKIVSVSTTKTSKVKLDGFDESDLGKIESIQSFIRESIRKIYDLLPEEIDSFIYKEEQEGSEELTESSRDFSLSELRRDLEFSLLQLEELENSSFETIDEETLEKSMNFLIGTRSQIFEKLRTFFSGKSMEKPSDIRLLDIFEKKIENKKRNLCLKDLHLYSYIDPSLFSEVKLKKNSLQIFLGKLLDFCIDDADCRAAFNISLYPDGNVLKCDISYEKEVFSETLLKLYRSYFESRKNYIFIKDNKLDEELVLVYQCFSGNGYSANVEYVDGKLIFSIVMPYLPSSKSQLAILNRENKRIIGILFDRTKDYQSANLLAKYLIHMGLDMKDIIVSDRIEKFREVDVTHFVVYQSSLSEDTIHLFKKYSDGGSKILLIDEDCMDNSSDVKIFDFSAIDYHMSKEDIYLAHLKYFLGSNLE